MSKKKKHKEDENLAPFFRGSDDILDPSDIEGPLHSKSFREDQEEDDDRNMFTHLLDED